MVWVQNAGFGLIWQIPVTEKSNFEPTSSEYFIRAKSF